MIGLTYIIDIDSFKEIVNVVDIVGGRLALIVAGSDWLLADPALVLIERLTWTGCADE